MKLITNIRKAFDTVSGSLFGYNEDKLKRKLGVESLAGADLQGKSLRLASLRNADLHGTNLQNVNLQTADLEGANLRGANLRGAIMRGVMMQGADLQDADFKGADLRGTYVVTISGIYGNSSAIEIKTDMSGVKNVTVAQLAQAIVDGSTIFPEGITLDLIEQERAKEKVATPPPPQPS